MNYFSNKFSGARIWCIICDHFSYNNCIQFFLIKSVAVWNRCCNLFNVFYFTDFIAFKCAWHERTFEQKRDLYTHKLNFYFHKIHFVLVKVLVLCRMKFLWREVHVGHNSKCTGLQSVVIMTFSHSLLVSFISRSTLRVKMQHEKNAKIKRYLIFS